MKPGFAYEGGGQVNTTPQTNEAGGESVASQLEEPKYDLVQSFGDFEIRRYHTNIKPEFK